MTLREKDLFALGWTRVHYVKPAGTDPRLTLCIVQDSIMGMQQNGGSAYMHRHVSVSYTHLNIHRYMNMYYIFFLGHIAQQIVFMYACFV